MADIKNFSLAGVARNVQLGKKGNKLISEAGALSFKTEDEANLIKLNIADPTANEHATTKKYVDDLINDVNADLGNLNSTRISNVKEGYNSYVGTAETGKEGKVVVGAEKTAGVVNEVAEFSSGADANSHFVFNNAEADTVTFTADGAGADVNVKIAPKGSGKIELGNSDEAVTIQAEEGQVLTVAGGDAVQGSNTDGGNLVLRPGAGDGTGANGALVIQAGTGEALVKFAGDAGDVDHLSVKTGLGETTIASDGESVDVNIIIAPKGAGNVSVSNKNINNVADPVANKDAANKQYVDSKIATGAIGGIQTREASFTTTGGNLGAPVSGTLRRLMVRIKTAMNAGAQITVGTVSTPALLLGSADIDETHVGYYELNLQNDKFTNSQIVVTVTGATSGAFDVLAEFAAA